MVVIRRRDPSKMGGYLVVVIRIFYKYILRSGSCRRIRWRSVYIWKTDYEYIYKKPWCNRQWSWDTCNYYDSILLLWYNGSFSGSITRYGIFICAYDTVCNRNCRCQNFMDICIVSSSQVFVLSFHLISCFMDYNYSHAGGMLLVSTEESGKGIIKSWRNA